MSDLFFIFFSRRASYTSSSSFLGPYHTFFNVTCTLISSVELPGRFLMIGLITDLRVQHILQYSGCLIIRRKDCYPESRAQGVFGVYLAEVTVRF
jgi:hypothetical protein